ncbi:MAG: hypothetical protein HOK54_23435 [Alphaproteobacteria bacterium]|nr:hypothetical protein [Alphaproteobacteria bacterium]
MLNARNALSLESQRCMTAPKASQGKQLGSDPRMKMPPSDSACMSAFPEPASRYVPAAPAQTS